MVNQTKWSFYQPFLQKEFGNILFTDTIVFDYGNEDCFAPFIVRDIPDVIYESFQNTGSRMGLQISPSWHDSISRIYFTGPGKELHYAAQLAVNNQWNQASVIWNRLSESDNRRLASMLHSTWHWHGKEMTNSTRPCFGSAIPTVCSAAVKLWYTRRHLKPDLRTGLYSISK